MVKCNERQIDQAFAALAHPARRAMLGRLAAGESSVTELAEPFEMSLPAVSKHIRVLERAGLLLQERDGRVRRCHLCPEPLRQVSAWVEHYRRFWEGQLGSLANYLKQVKHEEHNDG